MFLVKIFIFLMFLSYKEMFFIFDIKKNKFDNFFSFSETLPNMFICLCLYKSMSMNLQ